MKVWLGKGGGGKKWVDKKEGYNAAKQREDENNLARDRFGFVFSRTRHSTEITKDEERMKKRFIGRAALPSLN